jgi:hypothetical protein
MNMLKRKFLLKFVLSLFVVGIILGVIFNLAYKANFEPDFESFKEFIGTGHINTFMPHIILIIGTFILSISVIGIPLIIFYTFYIGLAFGFTITTFIKFYHLKGLLFYVLYFMSTKLIFYILLLYFIILSLRFSYKLVNSLIRKDTKELYTVIIYHFYRFLIVIFFSILNSAIIYFLSKLILSKMVNLI